jgi:peptide-methionine (S)-S-oxide reductase
VFYADATQQQLASAYIAQLDAAKVYRSKIVTRLEPLNGFYAAEDYHQDYATLHPESGYIRTFDLPKIANLKAMFPQWYRDAPVLVSAASAKR